MLRRPETEAVLHAPFRRKPDPGPHVRSKPGLGLIGAGAFGTFCVPHLRDRFDIRLSDPRPDIGDVADRLGVAASDLDIAAAQDIVVLAVPWRALESVAGEIAPRLKPGALVIEVCSIKVKPLSVLAERLPDTVDIVGTHPLFGPQSGRHGIAGLNIAVCGLPGRERATRKVAGFLRTLGLSVVQTSPAEHDRQMAYVQGLTHVIARSIAAIEVPPLGLTTTTWQHLMRMVETVRQDSDDLFRTIAEDNPYSPDVRERFAAALVAVSPVVRDLADAAASVRSGEIARNGAAALRPAAHDIDIVATLEEVWTARIDDDQRA